MESLGDYFYLIIIAVVAISSLLKKKTKDTVLNDNPESTNPEWEEVLRELTLPDEEPVLPQATVIVDTAEPLLLNNNETTTESSRFSTKPHFSTTNKIHQSTPKNDHEEAGIQDITNYQLDTVEEAQRAFVYSEIFSRKY